MQMDSDRTDGYSRLVRDLPGATLQNRLRRRRPGTVTDREHHTDEPCTTAFAHAMQLKPDRDQVAALWHHTVPAWCLWPLHAGVPVRRT